MPKRLYRVKPCMILTNTRTAPLCKIRFGSNDYTNCSIVQNSVASDERINCLSLEIRLLGLLKYHVEMPKSKKGHPYTWLGQVIPNYCHSEYGNL